MIMPDSKLLLNSITVDNVSTSLANSGLDVDANSTVTSLTVAHTTPVSIASGIVPIWSNNCNSRLHKVRMRQVHLPQLLQ